MPSDRIVAVLAYAGHCLEMLRKARSEDDMHEIAERMATVAKAKLHPSERRCNLVSALMAAETIDQEYVAWVLGGAAPLEDSKYPYWDLVLRNAGEL